MKKILVILFTLHSSLFTVLAQEHLVFTPHWRAQAQFAGYYVAKEKGFYKEVGLDVDIVHPLATQAPLDCIRSGECQVVTMQLCQAMDVIDNNIPIVNILQTSMNSSTIIISRRGKNPLTQKGARVGTWPNFDAMTYCMNMREHLEFDWVHLISSVNLFIKGGLDAMTGMSYNEYYQVKQAGFALPEEQICRLSDHGFNVQEDGVYMIQSYYRSHKQQAQKFAKASRKGWEWAASHQEEALEIVMKYVRKDLVGTNRTLQKYMLEEVLRQQIDKQSGKREFRLRPDMVQLASSMMLESHLLKHVVKYEQLIDK